MLSSRDYASRVAVGEGIGTIVGCKVYVDSVLVIGIEVVICSVWEKATTSRNNTAVIDADLRPLII
jgi:hypothetical protein